MPIDDIISESRIYLEDWEIGLLGENYSNMGELGEREFNRYKFLLNNLRNNAGSIDNFDLLHQNSMEILQEHGLGEVKSRIYMAYASLCGSLEEKNLRSIFLIYKSRISKDYLHIVFHDMEENHGHMVLTRKSVPKEGGDERQSAVLSAPGRSSFDSRIYRADRLVEFIEGRPTIKYDYN